MHPNERGGWSDIVGDADEMLDEAERTHPQGTRPFDLDADEEFTDPVLKAMAELDGAVAAKKARNVSTAARKLDPRPSAPDKASSGPNKPATQKPKLQLPLPGASSKKPAEAFSADMENETTVERDAPKPVATPSPSRKSNPPKSAMVVDSEPFSAMNLVDKLQDSDDRKPQVSFFQEYKDLIKTGVIGLLLVAAAIGYQVTHSTPEEERKREAENNINSPTQPIREDKPVVNPNLQANAAESKNRPPQDKGEQPVQDHRQEHEVVQAPEEETQEQGATSTPMITIISQPAGATVEIDGTSFGKTPLIMPAPRNVKEISVRLKLEKFRGWFERIPPNPSGHFTVNAELKPN